MKNIKKNNKHRVLVIALFVLMIAIANLFIWFNFASGGEAWDVFGFLLFFWNVLPFISLSFLTYLRFEKRKYTILTLVLFTFVLLNFWNYSAYISKSSTADIEHLFLAYLFIPIYLTAFISIAYGILLLLRKIISKFKDIPTEENLPNRSMEIISLVLPYIFLLLYFIGNIIWGW